MTLNTFNKLTTAIARLNQVDEDTAGDWLALIGDTPEFMPDGTVSIPDENGDPSGTTIQWPAEES